MRFGPLCVLLTNFETSIICGVRPMSLFVTVQGANHQTITLTYDSTVNANLAQQVALAIDAGITGGTVHPADSADGPPPPVTSGVGDFIQSTSGLTVVPHNYEYVNVPDTAAAAILYGNGDPDEVLLAGSGNLIFYAAGTATGAGTIIGGGGNDKITIPSSDNGAWAINLGNGNNLINAFGGGADTISTGTGHNQILLGNGGNTLFTSGFDTITAGSGSNTVFASGSNDLVYGNTSKLLFIGDGAAGTTVLGGSGSDTVDGGAGPDYFVGGTGGQNQLIAGTGAATLFGGGDGDFLQANGSGPQALYAASGNETLSGAGASGNDTFSGGSGNTYIIGGGGNDTIVDGSGAATVDANPGANNLFEFVNQGTGGTMLVRDLSDVSQIKIHLVGVTLDTQNNTGGSLNVTLSDGTSVTFQNIKGALGSGNFV